MSSSTSAAWRPALDLTSSGLARFDPARVEQAVEDGWQAGFEAGRAEALAQSRQDLDAALAQVAEQASTLLQAMAGAGEHLAATEAETARAYASTVAAAATGLATTLLSSTVDEDGLAAAAIERSLSVVERGRAVRVHLHPEDLALVDRATLPDGVTLHADGSLARGDAVARTDDRTVDARIETALDRAAAAITTALAEQAGPA